MYIRMSQYCDRVCILKSISEAVKAFDADKNPIKGLRRSTTVQIAAFSHDEPIRHSDIPDARAVEFEDWRGRQLSRIEVAFIEHAAAGKLGGFPLLKTKAEMGNPDYRVGEFSGLIGTVIDVQPGMIKNIMNSKALVHADLPKSMTLAEECSAENIIRAFTEMTEKFIRRIHLSGQKGCDLYTLEEMLDIRRAHFLFSKASDGNGTGYEKVTGNVKLELGDGTATIRNPSSEAEEMYKEMLKSIKG